MSKKYTKSSAFAYFGTKQTNEVWGWSAIAEDKSVVAVTIWKDRLEYNNGKPFYDGFAEENLDEWKDDTGNNDRKIKLQYAIESLNSLVRVVITQAVDVNAEPREIADVFPYKNLWFKITKFDPTTGQFKLEFSHKDD